MKILLSGSHGLIGTALKAHLLHCGHEVIPLHRDMSLSLDFAGVDAVVHLAGENIASGRWTTAKKRRIESSRVDSTLLLAKQMAASKEKPSVFISASAIGYYGDRGNEELTELSHAASGFLADVCARWEKSALPAFDAGIRTVHLRTGIVLSREGGALKKMLPPFKMGGGGIMGSGKQYMSWISLADVVGIIDHLIAHEEVRGAVNVVSPNPVTNAEFTKTLGKVLHRPAIIPMPAIAARLLFGEMAEALLLSSARVLPEKLLDAGYEFKHADLESTLEDILR